MKRYFFFLFLPVFALVFASGCDKNNNVVFFSVEDDIELGRQVSREIANDPSYDLLPEAEYPESYAYLEGVVNHILNSGEVAYRDEFVWEVTIVKDDDVLNAFATPGGYIYVYTGLIKYLDNVDALAGVLGHEIAHADLRHTSRNLQKQYGVSILLDILIGEDASQLEQIAGQIAGTIAGLKFSREYESEADARSVEYLAKTPYACDGVALFFQKLEDSGQSGSTPQFLSTHPSSENRITDINEKVINEGCDTQLVTDSGYDEFKASLP